MQLLNLPTEKLSLSQYHDVLREILVLQLKEGSSPVALQKLKDLSKYPFWQSCELAWALLACNCQLSNISCSKIALLQEESGCLLLLKNQRFMWDALPYPRLHAEVGALLALMAINGKEEYSQIALKMGKWQERLLDHLQRPLFSPWLQEGTLSYAELTLANFFFFNQLAELDGETFAPLAERIGKSLVVAKEKTPFWDLVDFFPRKNSSSKSLKKKEGFFYDPASVFAKKDGPISTISLFGSGCRSTMGLYLYDNGGVVGFGPQHLPLGSCEEFGLSTSRALFQKSASIVEAPDSNEFALSFTARLSAKSERKRYPNIGDSGFSGCWLEANLSIKEEELNISCQMQGIEPTSNWVFVFFAKAKSAFVAGSHKLNPRSLDRYKGPPQEMIFDVGTTFLKLHAIKGVEMMEVIPLAGDDNFWSADFLIAYTLGIAPALWQIAPH